MTFWVTDQGESYLKKKKSGRKIKGEFASFHSSPPALNERGQMAGTFPFN